MTPAVFFDRDGTVIEHVHHLTSPTDVRLVADAAHTIKRLQSKGYRCVIVTNQSVVGRGLLTEQGLAEVHEEMARQLVEHSVRLDGVYHCPVAPMLNDPTVIEHPDRKPAPGMLLRAARDMDLDMSESWMIGDTIGDILAGWNARCRGAILLRTGCGKDFDGELPDGAFVAASLTAAADIILETTGRNAITEKCRSTDEVGS